MSKFRTQYFSMPHLASRISDRLRIQPWIRLCHPCEAWRP
uniref:Uncharacterized protein n=1 Tax=Rhizophora mucronata TaxID=61149 RepID=A0A2P2P1R9_RHIMU